MSWFKKLLPFIWGITGFYLVVGLRALNPKNLAWLDTGDLALNHFGWALFRWGPWSNPVGLNPWASLDLTSSIVYTDSIPLLAVFFKVFSIFLPDPFQYIGIWYLICFLLQSYFGWKLAGLCLQSPVERFIASGIFVFAPPMLWRIKAHSALAGHFLILAALFLCLKRTNKPSKLDFLYWALLLASAIAINFYIFIIVATLWAGHLLDCYFINKTINTRSFIFEFTFMTVLIVFLSWQLGYFVIPFNSSPAFGFGHDGQKFNLIYLFIPEGWSHIWNPQFPIYSHDSYAWLGWGVLCLLILGVISFLKRPTHANLLVKIKNNPYLLICLIGLVIFSMSNKFSIGTFNWTFSIPNEVERMANLLRSSARLFWPAYYLILLFSIYIVSITFKSKTRIFLLGICVGFQIIDSSNGWISTRKILMDGNSSEYRSKQASGFSRIISEPLTDPFWQLAAKKYRKVTQDSLIDWPEKPNNWDTIAAYAAKYHLQTNSFYYARGDLNQYQALNEKLANSNKTGSFERDTLYILNDPEATIVSQNANLNLHLLQRINGINVLAPFWFESNNIELASPHLQSLPKIRVGEAILFSKDSAGSQFLGGKLDNDYHRFGWSLPEAWGTWSDERNARLILPIPANSTPKTLSLKLQVIFSNSDQVINIYQKYLTKGEFFTGTFLNKIIIPKPDNKNLLSAEVSIKITPEMIKDGVVNLEFQFLTPVIPKDIGMGDDTRMLSIGLISATFN